ncbi:MAG TPA: DUF4157 domain-containing protein [Cytophagales bacterium]|nr:DUF4157 domain-containing protein [Cytophagales bacterium]
MRAVESKTTATVARKSTPFFSNERGKDFFKTNVRDQSFFSKGKSATPFLQPKLTISQPNDPFEKEADAMADKVVQRMEVNPTLHTGLETANSVAPSIQAKCASCEEEKLQKKEEENKELKEKIQTKPIFESNIPPEENIQRKCTHCEKEEKLQAKGENTSIGKSKNLESNLIRSKGNGSPLSNGIKNQMESSFGRNFSNVRIHNNSSSIQMSKDLNAQAFTHESDIYFNSGKYTTNSTAGKHLLAHELTHVVQQGAAGRNTVNTSSDDNIQRKCGDENCSSIDPLTPACPDPVDFMINLQLETIRNSLFVSSDNPAVLKKGDAGNGVDLIQKLLLNVDCSSTERNGIRSEMRLGKFGSKTKAAVKIFQAGHKDGNGIALEVDGIVGPATLSAMDIIMDVPPTKPPLAPEGTGDCFGKAVHGPGESDILDPLKIPFMPAVQAWELSNFDIDKHFLKTEHRNFLRSKVITSINTLKSSLPAGRPIKIKIFGETSTTASDQHNKLLSERRAQCVFNTLVEMGIPEPLIIVQTGIGETLARLRLLLSGSPVLDNLEDRTERKVTIVLDIGGEAECSTTDRIRPSKKFVAKIACQSPDTYFINVGDVSDLTKPTYREFMWVHDGIRKGCRYVPDAAPSNLLGVAASGDLHLAYGNPDNPFAHSDFQGKVELRSLTTTALLSRVSTVGDVFHIAVPGKWTDPDCGIDFEDLPGRMNPIGTVKCGNVPDPPESPNCEESEEPCSDVERQSAATKFVGRMARFSGDPAEVLRKIPFLRNVMRYVDKFLEFIGKKAIVGGAYVTLSTKDLATPITRDFVFLGAGLNSSGRTFEGDVSYADEFTLDNPKQLENATSGLLLHGSDFEGGSTLTIKGGSNKTDLHIGGNGINKTVSFKGFFCNSSSDRVSHGKLLPASNASCDSIFVLSMPDRNCKGEEEDCPPSRKVDYGRRFRVRTGRAVYSSLPVIGKQLADRIGGCGATLSFINIGTDTGNDKWIYREFLFIGKNNVCPFTVSEGDFFIDFIVPRFLSLESGDDPYALSHFIGPSTLNAAKNFHITNVPSADFNLPGKYLPDAASCGGASVNGATIPLSAVECGEVPHPLHFTTPEPSDLDRCKDFRNSNSFVLGEIFKLKMGYYDDIIKSIATPPGLRYEKYRELSKLIGSRVNNGVFAGKTSSGEPVITIVDFGVVSMSRDPVFGYLFKVQILSDPCTYNKDGKPVLLRPEGCFEGFIKNGGFSTIYPIVKIPSTPDSGSKDDSNTGKNKKILT